MAERARPVLVTERLALREFRPGDAEALYRLDSDPRVMRYIGNGSVGTRAAVVAAVTRSMRYYGTYPGLGVWPAEDRVSGEFIGWFCLKYVPDTVEVEVGYRLAPSAWGRGYATEGARGVVRHGFTDLGLSRIIGLTHPDNAASQRVLRKAGLTDAGWGNYYRRRLRLFVAEAQDLPTHLPSHLP
jgi:RimJ/RimL family protein N-acetyltransferase